MELKIQQKVQLQESEPSKAEISCPEPLNPFRFILTSVKNAMFRILKGTLNLLEIHQNKNFFLRCLMVENS